MDRYGGWQVEEREEAEAGMSVGPFNKAQETSTQATSAEFISHQCKVHGSQNGRAGTTHLQKSLHLPLLCNDHNENLVAADSERCTAGTGTKALVRAGLGDFVHMCIMIGQITV